MYGKCLLGLSPLRFAKIDRAVIQIQAEASQLCLLLSNPHSLVRYISQISHKPKHQASYVHQLSYLTPIQPYSTIFNRIQPYSITITLLGFLGLTRASTLYFSAKHNAIFQVRALVKAPLYDEESPKARVGPAELWWFLWPEQP